MDSRPHSRACGYRPHEHGSLCHSNCPTCRGKDEPARLPDTPDSGSETDPSASSAPMPLDETVAIVNAMGPLETEAAPVVGHDKLEWEPWTSVNFEGADGYGHRDKIRISVFGRFVFLGILDGLGSARLDSTSMRELGELLIEGAEVIEHRMAANISQPIVDG